MKPDKKSQLLQRQVIENRISRLANLSAPSPRAGWIKAIRGSLGITAKQLSQRLGTTPSSVIQLEEREPEKKVTLESLERAANAMDCTLVYAIVPRAPYKTLDDIIEAKALEAAARILKDVAHTMRLEAQGTSKEESLKQIERTAHELKAKVDSRIWDWTPTTTKGRK